MNTKNRISCSIYILILLGILFFIPTADTHASEELIQKQAPLIQEGSPTISPKRITETLKPGESKLVSFRVYTGEIPFKKGDVMFTFDRTGSMGEEINEAKKAAIEIMNGVKTKLPNTWFGVASFMDYPNSFTYPGYSDLYGSGGDVPWMLNLQPVENIADVSNQINGLWIGNGADWPEDYTRVIYELSQDGVINWRLDTKKIVVLFGDAPTHDLNFAGFNFGGDPGRDGIPQNSDDLDFENVVQGAADKNLSIIAIDSGYTLQSEATFKGMSIGYATAIGTKGAYYNLRDVTQIPDKTVQLITSETQSIDHLTLKVTQGYENWVKITPSEFTNVGSKSNVDFNVEIKIPDGTSSGYYPFLIQAIGDGSILDIAYAEVIVPTESPINDIGFRPKPNGFGFSNTSSKQTWEMFKQFFGKENVEYSNGNRIYAADQFYKKHYQLIGKDGSCDGFSVTSLINYKKLSQPNAGIYNMPQYENLFDQKVNNDITEAYTFAQGIQSGIEINNHSSLMCDTLGKSPKAFFNYLKSLIQNNSPSVLGIKWTKSYGIGGFLGPGAHALIPYKYEEPSSDKAIVYVYDSNLPGNDKHSV